MNAVYSLTWIEHEFGQRSDGISLHIDLDEVQHWRKKFDIRYHDRSPSSAPDQY